MRHFLYLSILLLLMACVSTSTIHTQPLDTEVYINGQLCGVSPCIHHDRYGFPDRMRVQIRSPGYESAEFFVDTQAPIASYALMGFGSYVFHTFSKEYRFSLIPLDTMAESGGPSFVGTSHLYNDSEITNILEQCLYWSEQNVKDVWDKRFTESAVSLDCKMAESALLSPSTKMIEPAPALARALIRYMDYRRRSNMPTLVIPWSTEELCNTAKVEYAKRVGATEVPPAFPGFDELCPKESKQIRGL